MAVARECIQGFRNPPTPPLSCDTAIDSYEEAVSKTPFQLSPLVEIVTFEANTEKKECSTVGYRNKWYRNLFVETFGFQISGNPSDELILDKQEIVQH